MNPLLLLIAWPVVLVVSLPFVIAVCRASAQAEDAAVEGMRYLQLRSPVSDSGDVGELGELLAVGDLPVDPAAAEPSGTASRAD